MRRFLFFAIFFILFSSCVQEKSEEANDKEYMGMDVHRKMRTCRPMKEGICTREFTPADQFGLDCKAKGKVAIQCGCHDWICVE